MNNEQKDSNRMGSIPKKNEEQNLVPKRREMKKEGCAVIEGFRKGPKPSHSIRSIPRCILCTLKLPPPILKLQGLFLN